MTHRQLPIRGPFQGVVSDVTGLSSPPNAFDDVVNFFVRKGKIHSRNRLNVFLPASGSNPLIRTFGKFKDANGSLHSFALANYNTSVTPAYMITAGPVLNPLAIPGLTAGQQGSTLPFGELYSRNQVFFANGGYPLMYLDGSNSVQFAGDTPGTCRFLAINVNHVIQASCIEPAKGISGSTDLPRRVRWSATGNPLEWDPTIDFTAGLADLLDVPDDITGINTIGRNSFIWRTNGVTVMIPTGIGLSPFDFDNYSVSPEGIGNFFPYTLATWDNQSISVAENDIYRFDGTGFTPIGGPNRKKIYADLAAASGDVVTGRILPNFTLGYDFACYLLTIPGPNVSWLYDFDFGQWVRFSSSQGYLTAARTVYTS